jgi:ketosteroid isomerase-like protein
MHSRRVALAAGFAVILSVAACVKVADPDTGRKEIEQLLQAYLRSVKTADVALASTVWLQSPDIVVVTPLGRYDGWDAVQRELYVNFLQKAFLERDLQASNVHIHVNGDLAWAIFDWNFTAKMANGQPMTSKGRETHVYEKTANGWRITHLHYSGLLPQQQQ